MPMGGGWLTGTCRMDQVLQKRNRIVRSPWTHHRRHHHLSALTDEEFPLLRGVRLQADLREVRLKPDATYNRALNTIVRGKACEVVPVFRARVGASGNTVSTAQIRDAAAQSVRHRRDTC